MSAYWLPGTVKDAGNTRMNETLALNSKRTIPVRDTDD